MNRTNTQELLLTLLTCHGLVLHLLPRPLSKCFLVYMSSEKQDQSLLLVAIKVKILILLTHCQESIEICTDKHISLYIQNAWVSGPDTGL